MEKEDFNKQVIVFHLLDDHTTKVSLKNFSFKIKVNEKLNQYKYENSEW